ncbi:hypothetical protein N7507_011647 [Penicillium longicatenatum]|nr:hypothetical protein N7507_011647 [Penicillium longicatenatum]
MDPVELTNRSNYARRLGIEFLGPNEVHRWPETHQRLFEDAQKLGCQKHDSFIEMISIDSIEKPWRRTTISRAKRLSQMAQKCFNETRNERGWRLAIENEIMYRFTVEVACPQCRNRLWQSEIPAATNSFLKQADSLENRRRDRKPCRCPSARGDNRYDGGINMLFSDRAEATIKHSPALVLSTQPPKLKHYEAPDRIFGLRQTDNFRFLLDSTDKRHTETSNAILRESIEHSPFSAEPEPLLFPFLMIEAKSSKGADRAEVQMQSAFCLRRLLKLQHDLVAATGEETEWATGPLVWFLGTRGEQWDLYAGFVEEIDSGTVRYPIVDLWSGDIRREDGALQLLLLVDYIFDWARDIYRNAIINELNTLATGEITDKDPDLFSTISRRMSRISSWTSFSHARDPSQVSFDSEPQEQSFLNIVFPEGVIRDASIIESRFFLLQITEDDVDTFLLSFSSVQEAQNWLQNVLKCLPDAWRVCSKTIHAMESVWTEEPRPPRENYRQEETFYINFVIIMFMTNNWEPVRQLTSLAISEGALKSLMAKIGRDMDLDFEGCPEVGESSIQSILERILKQSILDNLTAAVSMLSFVISTARYGSNKNGKIKQTQNAFGDGEKDWKTCKAFG